ASYLLNQNKPNHSLEDVALNYLAIKKISFDEIFGKGKGDFSEVSIEDATRYSAEDAAVTAKLKKALETSIKEQGIDTLFYELELPLIEVLADMEMAGVKIDINLMADMSKELDRELDGLQRRIYFLAGGEFNINSPKQLQEVLFKRLGLRAVKKIKTGYSTDVGVLEELALQHELPREILEHRALSKLKSTYVDALPEIINPRTGRLHTSFNQTVTATGRLSSSEPNLQNIPIRGEWGRRIRSAFISEDGYLLMSSDYSHIELRLLAHLSQDTGLLDAFRADGDIHTKTASELFGVSPEAVTPEMRRRAKTVNFGIVYGISPYGLSQELGITPQEAKMFIDKYFERHSGVKEYIDTLIRAVKEKGYVETILCRRRAIPELRSPNKITRQLGERLAVNSPIQGSAADIIKCAMLNIWRRIKKERLKTKMLLQVHDELLFEVPEDEVDKAMILVKEEMERAVRLSVPLRVEMGLGRNWVEAH
ncbi:MAG TPA: DNA polymerase I, partial [Nitrospiraceae bacterium]|nr:DNA polymerase I [Nitrospiraceae bacterium]